MNCSTDPTGKGIRRVQAKYIVTPSAYASADAFTDAGSLICSGATKPGVPDRYAAFEPSLGGSKHTPHAARADDLVQYVPSVCELPTRRKHELALVLVLVLAISSAWPRLAYMATPTW